MTVLKDSPAVGDVHVSTTGGARRQRKAPISPDTKLPVTGATMAAQAENPDDDASPLGKLNALFQKVRDADADADAKVTAALTQIMHDCSCAMGAQCQDVEADTGKGGRSGGGKAKTAKADDKRLMLAVRGDEGQVAALLEHIKETAAIGHSFSVVVDPGDPDYEQKFGFDGDGAFRIVSIQESAAKRDDAAGGDEAWSIPVAVAKADPDQQLIWGWASVVEIDGRAVVDKQDDVILVGDLQKAAHEFVASSRQHGEMHQNIGTGTLVESMVFTKELQKALGIDLGKVGWLVGFHVSDPQVWKSIKAGELPELSIGGSGTRETV